MNSSPHKPGGVGIDIEAMLPDRTAEEIGNSVVNNKERAVLHNSVYDFSFMLTLVFSAKESLFKALYPYVKYYFGFEVATIVDCDLLAKTFTLELVGSLTAEHSAGKRYTGYFMIIENEIMTFVYFS